MNKETLKKWIESSMNIDLYDREEDVAVAAYNKAIDDVTESLFSVEGLDFGIKQSMTIMD